MNAIILIVLGVFLIVFNVRAVKNDKKSFDGILSDKQNNVKDYEVEITKLREEFSNTILELQKEIEDLKARPIKYEGKDYEIINNVSRKNKNNGEKLSKIYEGKVHNKVSNGVNVNEIKELLDSGISIDDICKKLDMNKGEVLLVKELYVK
ncbi:hypothetical protein D4Z93_09040 [Clostridium fermenticellae]|uniref:Uncharacterized protein n=1 Tax=Clostridium fermenticellae TaxID=2068654 RepID=A0A386H4K5_9CLOT|nr:hypothetical protein [Clostridium fermenticellae]AYD40667.1 hypothetical protein D4Z93_09040 [Clostridium fermenticellae]